MSDVILCCRCCLNVKWTCAISFAEDHHSDILCSFPRASHSLVTLCVQFINTFRFSGPSSPNHDLLTIDCLFQDGGRLQGGEWVDLSMNHYIYKISLYHVWRCVKIYSKFGTSWHTSWDQDVETSYAALARDSLKVPWWITLQYILPL